MPLLQTLLIATALMAGCGSKDEDSLDADANADSDGDGGSRQK